MAYLPLQSPQARQDCFTNAIAAVAVIACASTGTSGLPRCAMARSIRFAQRFAALGVRLRVASIADTANRPTSSSVAVISGRILDTLYCRPDDDLRAQNGGSSRLIRTCGRGCDGESHDNAGHSETHGQATAYPSLKVA